MSGHSWKWHFFILGGKDLGNQFLSFLDYWTVEQTTSLYKISSNIFHSQENVESEDWEKKKDLKLTYSLDNMYLAFCKMFYINYII